LYRRILFVDELHSTTSTFTPKTDKCWEDWRTSEKWRENSATGGRDVPDMAVAKGFVDRQKVQWGIRRDSQQ
jgi:hypothetical protein